MTKNYLTAIPIMNHLAAEDKRAAYAAELHRAGAGRVFLCIPRHFHDSPARRNTLALLKKNIAYFETEGFDVGVWFSAVGHGGPLEHEESLDAGNFTHITGFDGGICDDSFCVSDPDFIEATADYVCEITKAGAKMIMLDDDFRLGYRTNGMGCTCERHLALFAAKCGQSIPREKLYAALFTGKPSARRTAWLDLMGESMNSFARALRSVVDEINPETRLGFCAAPTSWDADGTDVVEITRIFAGKTKPFLRLIGAAYWANNTSHSLADVIGYERLQLNWVKEKAPDIEVFSEGDVYPRPRYRVPSWLVEGFDSALRADARPDGILKYMIDYTQTPEYETGYIDRHVRNLQLHEEIRGAFSDGTTKGVYVYQTEHILRNAVFDETEPPPMGFLQDTFVSPAAKLLNVTSTPLAVDASDNAVCVCGESAREMPLSLLRNGVILDAISAKILSERGIDVGFTEMELCGAPDSEYFPNDRNETVRSESGGHYFRFTLKPQTEVLSVFRTNEKERPAVWYYENPDGQRFLVYSFELFFADFHAPLMRGYCRQKQLHDGIMRLQNGTPLPVLCEKEPDLFFIVKDKPETKERTVGVWNFSDDVILTPKITLDRVFSAVTFFENAKGTLVGNTVCFADDLPAHSFTGFLLKD